jgi:hypothetical protein
VGRRRRARAPPGRGGERPARRGCTAVQSSQLTHSPKEPPGFTSLEHIPIKWSSGFKIAQLQNVQLGPLPRGVYVPFLYVNLIEASGVGLQDMAAFLQRTFSAPERSAWGLGFRV